MIAADVICCHPLRCAITYLEGFVPNQPVLYSVDIIMIVCGASMAASLRAFRVEYYCRTSEWLKLFGWLTARSPPRLHVLLSSFCMLCCARWGSSYEIHATLSVCGKPAAPQSRYLAFQSACNVSRSTPRQRIFAAVEYSTCLRLNSLDLGVFVS